MFFLVKKSAMFLYSVEVIGRWSGWMMITQSRTPTLETRICILRSKCDGKCLPMIKRMCQWVCKDNIMSIRDSSQRVSKKANLWCSILVFCVRWFKAARSFLFWEKGESCWDSIISNINHTCIITKVSRSLMNSAIMTKWFNMIKKNEVESKK